VSGSQKGLGKSARHRLGFFVRESMDESGERYRREQDLLLFQNTEEKAKLQEQAITGERLRAQP